MGRLERLNLLAESLKKRSAIRLRDTATLLGVSEMTVRRDIATSPDKFTYLGGYIVGATDILNEAGYTIDQEKDHFAQAKAESSKIAASLLTDEQTIFIDCGTTLTVLARLIPPDLKLTVICYSLNVAEILRHKSNIRMVLLGGIYVPSSDSFSGDGSIDTLRGMGINQAFISAGGVDDSRGVTCWNFHEVGIKQAAISSAVASHLVIDRSKLGKVRAARFAQLDDFDTMITESGQTPCSTGKSTRRSSNSSPAWSSGNIVGHSPTGR